MDAFPTAMPVDGLQGLEGLSWLGDSANPLVFLKTVSAVLWGNFWLISIIILILLAFFVVVFWKFFAKAWRKGYESLISGHNAFEMVRIAGKQGRYYFLFLIPIVIMNWPLLFGIFNPTVLKIFSIIGGLWFAGLYIDLTFSMAKRFKKGSWFAIWLAILPCIFYPILALGKSKYSK